VKSAQTFTCSTLQAESSYDPTVAVFSPELHEPLVEDTWSEKRAVEALRAIVTDADEQYDDEAFWAPADEWDDWGGEARLPLTTLSTGAAGVAWGLDRLRRRGHAEPRTDTARVAVRAVEAWRTAPDLDEHLEPPVSTHAGLFMGETGPLVVAFLETRSSALADDLHARVVANADCETNELFFGSPGTMVVARAMHSATGEQRWSEAWRASAEILLARRDDDGFWTYPPYGKAPGASHGLASNAKILLAGDDLLAPSVCDRLSVESAAALAGTAVVEDGVANWPLAVGDGLVGFDGVIRTQWCHGAAGVAEAAAGFLDEALLRQAGELVWRAGPPSVKKGTGICHGTAGSGFALLKVFARTQDELWLERARRFAMHVASQVERSRQRRGRGRVALWTGDIGAALYLAACIDVDPSLPIVDAV
jgi:hypothetical protein